MLTTVLERAVAALPRQDRTEERKTRLASSILGAAARGERDPLLLYATALGGGPWEPAIGEGPASQPIRSTHGRHPGSRSRDATRLPLAHAPADFSFAGRQQISPLDVYHVRGQHPQLDLYMRGVRIP